MFAEPPVGFTSQQLPNPLTEAQFQSATIMINLQKRGIVSCQKTPAKDLCSSVSKSSET